MGMRFLFILIALICLGPEVSAQTEEQDYSLALQFYRAGEYDKSAELFAKLHQKNPKSKNYYRFLYDSKLILEEYEDLEKLVKKQIKKNKDDLSFRVDLGNLYERQVLVEEAEKEYDEAVSLLKADQKQIQDLANAFTKIDKIDHALQTYEKGIAAMGSNPFIMQVAILYQKKGDHENMIRSYLDMLDERPEYLSNIQNYLQAYINTEEEQESLEEQIYARIQKNKDNLAYVDLLTWHYLQLGDFESAYIQAMALDKRFSEGGKRVYELARSAEQEGKYDAAVLGYDYVVANNEGSNLYHASRHALLRVQKDRIITKVNPPMNDLLDLQSNYYSYIDQSKRKTSTTAMTVKDLAWLEALYFEELDVAIELLQDVLTWNGISAGMKADLKLDLGDYQLMAADIYEATLTYSQVDKAMKDHPLGEMARFKNAQWSYYTADYPWAQSQLEVLKGSTSELIANDALKLSVFLTDNLGLDTTTDAMDLYAEADLLVFQMKYMDALVKLEELEQKFKTNMLVDDVLYKKANIYLKQGKNQEAMALLKKIETDFSYDLLADDALFKLGVLYETVLEDKEKAMDCFQSLILNYRDSLYIVEARKRFRKLRGDIIK